MKKQDIIFQIIKILLDFIIIFSSFFIARELRLFSDFILNFNLPIQTIDSYNLFIYSLVACFITIFLFSFHWLYRIKIINSKIKEFIQIFLYTFYSFIFFSVIVYLWNWFIFDKEIPRLIILFSFIISLIWIIIWRILLNNLQYFFIKKNIFSKNNLVILVNKKQYFIKNILQDIKNAKLYKIIWYCNLKKQEKNKIKYLNLKEIKNKIKNREIDEIIYIDSDFSKKQLYEIWELTRIFWIRYRYITNSFDITKSNTELSLINEIPVLEIKNTPLSGWNIFFKRIFDIVFWIFWIIIFIPFFIIFWILIKIEDFSWPIIFKNSRIGKNWKKFNLYKLRYMKWKYCIKDSYNVSNKEKNKALKYEQDLIQKKSTRKWPLYKIKNDPRKTKIWTFVEKYSLDELPQFFNLIIGNMSLVWPRPHQEREIKKYKIQYKRLLTIKPWITWMAQINWRDKNNFTNEAKLDLYYIENWNILLDLKIIIKTFVYIFFRK